MFSCGRKSDLIDDDHLLDALLSSPITILVGTTCDGIITRWSLGATELYGWSKEEILGQPVSLLQPEDRRAEFDLVRRLAAGVSIAPFETLRVHRDGTLIPVELHLVPLRDEEGRTVGGVALHRDLRRTRSVERALREREEELRARFSDSLVPQSRVDLQGRVLATNKALREMLGWDEQTLLRRNAVELYDEQDRPAVLEALARLASGEVTQLAQEHTLVRADGTLLRTVTSASLMHDASGQPQLAASVEDVTALREAEERMRTEAARYDALLQSMPVAVFTYDVHGRCTSSRGAALATLGLREGELVGRDLLELYADVPPVAGALRSSLAGQESRSAIEQAGRHWKTDYRPLRDSSGAVTGGIGIAVDITDLVVAEQEVRASEARLSSLLQHASDLALVIDVDGRVVYASPGVSRQLGYHHEDLIRRSAREFNHPEDRRVVSAGWREALRKPGGTARFECRVLHADGTWRWADHVFTNLLDDPAVGGMVVNVRETTERRLAEEELRGLAVRDTLTGLANRTLLLDRVEQTLVIGRRTGSVTGLVVLDVVGMSAHNERLGQQGGDAVLQMIGSRLESALRSGASAARVGGDEFAVHVTDVASAEDLRALASALLEVAREPIEFGGVTVQVELQAGTAMSPAADAGALLAAAERAVLHDRSSTGVMVRSARAVADPAMARSASADRLRRAIESRELVVHYQPVIRLATEEAAGVEALVRWQHPDRGLLLPAEFIPLAEESGLIVELGGWVLREACLRLAAWQAAGRQLSIGVNLSPRQLVGKDFPDLLRELLAETGARPDQLVLEVTESALMDDAGAPDVLRTVRELGVRLALDDFGTGYSSLTYLKRFPVDAIKIDRSFVSGLGHDPDDEAIVASVVSLARAVGKTVVAEGVETVGQLAALRALGVDQAQGFLWSRAISAADLDLWLEQPRGSIVASDGPVRVPPAAPIVTSGSDEERIFTLHAEGASLHTIAAALNAEGRRTTGGPRWTTQTVARVIASQLPRA